MSGGSGAGGADAPGTTTVRSGARDYPVVVEAGALDRLSELLEAHAPASEYAMVADGTVAELHGERILRSAASTGARTTLLTFPPGESSKSRAEWARLTDHLLEWGMGRGGVVIALGGGVAGDLAGFVAATYLRGVALVQLPTSLVAMIDSSVGGKTGVDVAAGKNLVGAFHPPRLVVADPEVVATLPRAQRAQGLAEAVKHGAILDRTYLEALEDAAEDLLEGRPEALIRAVRRSVELKAEVVGRDEREAGLRRILNFGHTLGHGLEASSGYRIPHGAAVSAGMVLEARIGERVGVSRAGTAAELARVLSRMELPTSPPDGVEVDDVLRFAARDKKGRGRLVLLTEPGRVAPGHGWTHPVDEEVVRDVLEGEV